jgi:hypothetical protein
LDRAAHAFGPSPESDAQTLHDAAHAAVALLAPFAERIEDDEEDAAQYEDALDRELRRRPSEDDHQSSRGYV